MNQTKSSFIHIQVHPANSPHHIHPCTAQFCADAERRGLGRAYGLTHRDRCRHLGKPAALIESIEDGANYRIKARVV